MEAVAYKFLKEMGKNLVGFACKMVLASACARCPDLLWDHGWILDLSQACKYGVK